MRLITLRHVTGDSRRQPTGLVCASIAGLNYIIAFEKGVMMMMMMMMTMTMMMVVVVVVFTVTIDSIFLQLRRHCVTVKPI